MKNFFTILTFWVSIIASFNSLAQSPDINVKYFMTSIPNNASANTTYGTSFGLVAVNNATPNTEFTIENRGTGTLTISSIEITGTEASDFTVSNSPSTTLAPNATTTLRITFNPSVANRRTATVTITSNDPDESPFRINLLGTGMQPEMDVFGNGNPIANGSSTPITNNHTHFGAEFVTGGSIVRTFTIDNNDLATLNLTGTPKVAISGSHASDFSLTAAPSSPIARSQSTTFQITFNPSGNGVRTALLSIANDDEDENPYTFAIEGIGTTPSSSADYTISTANNTVTITDVSGNGETIEVSESNSNVRFFVSGRTYSIDGGAVTPFTTPADIPISSNTGIVVNTNAGNDIITVGAFTSSLPSLTINGGVDDDIVNMNGNITFAANANLDLDLQNDDASPGKDVVNIGTNANVILAGTGSATIKVSQNVFVNTGGGLTTANGNLLVEANQQGTPTSGNFAGVRLDGLNSLFQVTGSGLLTVKGKGGDIGRTTYGIYMGRGGKIIGGTNTVTVEGVGGPTSSFGSYGVGMIALSEIRSTGGNIIINGTGNGTGTNSGGAGLAYDGVYVRGTISAGGTGNVTITGRGSLNNAEESLTGVGIFEGEVTTAGGNLTINGYGGGSGNTPRSNGIVISSNASVSSGGMGTLTLNGEGGVGTGSYNNGVILYGLITSGGGNVIVTGKEGGGTGSYGIAISNTIYGGSDGEINTSTNGGDILLRTNSFASESNTLTLITSHLSNKVTFLPLTNGVGINFVSTSDVVGGPITISDLEFDNITGGAIHLGDANTGVINVDEAITHSAGNVYFTTGQALNLNQSFGAGTGNIAINAAGGINPKSPTVDLSGNSISFTSGNNLNIAIGGTTVNTEYDQLNIQGTIDLTGLNLVLSGSYVPVAGNTFTIVNNDGTDAIVGTFNGLAEGATLSNFQGSGLNATISYTGGTDNNDVVITVAAPAVSNINIKGNDLTIDNGDTSPRTEDGTDFGNIDISLTEPVVRTFTIQNMGTADLIIPANGITKSGAADFGIGNVSLPLTIEPGGSATFPVIIDASGNGFRTATISIQSNDSDKSPYTFNVQAIGVSPEINVTGLGQNIADGDLTPSGVDDTDFGIIDVASGSVSHTFTIQNVTGATGNLQLNAGAISVTGTHASDFTVSAITLPATISAGQSTTFVVTFNPSAEGLRTATVRILNNDLGEGTYDFAVQGYGGKPFITTWKTDNTGTSNSTSITIPTTGTGYNYDVDWNNDGMFDEFGLTGSVTHNYGTAGTYTVAIRGNFPSIQFFDSGDKLKLLSIDQWGSIAWTSMNNAFRGCENMVLNATDVPNTSAVTDMSFMFAGCTSFNQALPEGFNTSLVTNMGGMFQGCSSYNQALPTSFNTSLVTNMSAMFSLCTAYNQDLPSGFNTERVTNMRTMFLDCSTYNKALPSSFNTSLVTDMYGMFSGCTAYNQDLPNSFNTERVTNMRTMFANCSAYDKALPSSFNTSLVTDMNGMFLGCSSYNQPFPSSFTTASVTDMAFMFNGCSAFNQPLPSSFNTTVVTTMRSMFERATAFNQNLGSLNLSAVTVMTDMLKNSGLSVANYDATLTGWDNGGYSNKNLSNASPLKYCAAQAARTNLITNKGWTITGDAQDFSCLSPDYTITTMGNNLVITDVTGTGETLDISQNGSNIRFNVTGKNFSLNNGTTTNFPADVPLSGLQIITVNTANGNDIINVGAFSSDLLPSLTLNGGTGDDQVNMNGDITFATNANLDVDLQNDDVSPGVDAITFAINANIILQGTGAATLKVSKNVVFNNGSTLGTNNGDLTVEANQQASPTTGNFIGISMVTNTQLQVLGSGTMTVKGTGGNDASGNQVGISLNFGGVINGGHNTVTVIGNGGASSGNSNYGILIQGSTASITSLGGAVNVEGTGGGTNGTSVGNEGVRIALSGQITSAGTGAITVTGRGATLSTGDFNVGVSIQGSAKITSVGGNVTVNAYGGGSGTSQLNYGLSMSQSGEISAGGTGTVTITGEGGLATGVSNHGIALEGLVKSAGGNIALTGKSGGGSSTYGIYMSKQGGAPVSSITTEVNGGNIAIITNSLRIVDSPDIRTNSSGRVTLKPFTAGTAIDFSFAPDGANGPLILSDLELDRISTGTLVVGDATMGDITVGIGITRPTLTNMELISGGDVIISGGSINTNGGTLLLDPGTSPKAVKPTFNDTDVTVSTLSFASASDLEIALNGTTIGDGTGNTYSQLNVAGEVNLTGLNLAFSGSYTPTGGETFTIVNNDDTDAIVGTFNGLAQGATISNFRGSGLNATISYTGGSDNNDVVITVASSQPDYTITTTGNNLVIIDVTGTGEILDISQNGSNIRFNVTGKKFSLNSGITTNFPADVALSGLQSITVNTANGSDIINVGAFSSEVLPSLTINGGTGDDQVNFNGDITFATNANLDLDLQNDDANPGVDAVTFAVDANLLLSGTGTATLKVSKNVIANTGSSLITQNGNLVVEANKQATPSSGDFAGVDVNGGSLKVTGSGQATIKGKSGVSGYKAGISVSNGGIIEGGTAALSVTGTGGTAAGNENIGVLVTGTNSKITSLGGNVSVVGQGDGIPGGYNQHGVAVESSGMITAGGTGTVTVQGTGASQTDGYTFGVHLDAGTITSSGGNVSVTGQGGGSKTSNHGVYLESSGLISAGGSGTVTVLGTGGTGTDGYHQGVFLTSSAITSTNGHISVTGQAGGASTGSANTGVLLDANSRIAAGGTGNVTVQGIGSSSPSTASFNYGLQLDDSNSQISTNNGNIRLIGQGGQGANGSFNNSTGNTGIGLSGKVLAGGTGTIYIEGTGANQSFSDGVEVGNLVTTNDGTITIIGVGGADATASNGSLGVDLDGTVTAGNGKAINIQGTAGSSTGPNNKGVYIRRTVNSTTGGAITITGIEGGSGVGIEIESFFGGQITTAAAGGDITFIANSINIKNTAEINTNASSTVTLRPYTNGVSIDLGAETDALDGPLSLSDAELDRITAGKLQIGDANSGTISVSGAISRTAATNIKLISGSDLVIGEAGINTGGGTLLLDPGTSPKSVKPTFNGTDATASTLSFASASNLEITFNGTTVGDGTGSTYSQLRIEGEVNLTGVDLVMTGSYTPVGSETFIIINNDGADAIQGNFNGLSQGATITNFRGSSFPATISYTGGDGNDVVITVGCSAFPAPTASVTAQPDCATSSGTITVTAPTGANIQYSVDGVSYQTSATFSQLSPNTYSVTAKNTQTGCVSQILSLTINAVPNAPTISSVNLTQPTCATNTGTAVVNASGTGTLEYSKDGTNWQESNTFANLPAGNYTFQVRLQNNTSCSNSSTQQTINPVPNAPTISSVNLTQPTCTTNTGTAVVNASGTGTLEYSKNGTNWQESNTFTNLASGNYTFQVRLQNNTSCSASSQQQTVNPVPNAPTISSVNLTQPTCATNTGTAVVNASGTGTLEYSKDGTNWQESNTFSGLASGNYTFQVRLKNSMTCSASSQQQTINATLISLTVFNLQGGTTLCASSSGNTPAAAIVLNGSQVGVIYQLKKDNQNFREPILGTGNNLVFSTITEAGTYTVEAFVEGGACLTNMNGSATINLGQTPNVFTLTGGGSYCNGGNGVAIGLSSSQTGMNYQLRRANTNIGNPIAGTGSAISFGNQTLAGTYTVIATDANSSCNRNMTGSKTVSVTNCNARVANKENSPIESTEIKEWATIAPNPVVNSFATVLIKGQDNQTIQWKLIDLKGSSIKENKFETISASHQEKISLEGLKPGTYLIRLQGIEKSITLKIIKAN